MTIGFLAIGRRAVLRSCCLLAAIAVWAAPSSAQAEIKFCNKFPHVVYAAMAYPQDEGSWISRGWLALETGECSLFDTALRVRTFYYRGESVAYRDGGKSVKSNWGSGMKFAILESGNFNYWNAQTKILNSSLADFSKAADTIGEGVSITITFEADGRSSTTISTDPASR